MRTISFLQVDFVLLGGDLFHDNNPSRYTLHRTMSILKKYCFGHRPGGHAFQILSEQSIHFQRAPIANMSDENLSIRLPIFSIHGNHDDPGEQALAALDVLHISSMVNYFGKTDVADQITIQPLMLRKGESTLALYGLGNIRDERLARMWAKDRVHFAPVPDFEDLPTPTSASQVHPIPSQSKASSKSKSKSKSGLSRASSRVTEDASQVSTTSSARLNDSVCGRNDTLLKILVLHQNRVPHTATSYVPESRVAGFDFVVWGHEHESVVTHTSRMDNEAYISQPGSTVATSLSEGEMAIKHAVLLQVFKGNYSVTPVPLASVRPFRLEHINLSELNIPAANMVTELQLCDAISQKLAEQINRILQEIADDTCTDGSNPNARWTNNKLPLVRLKVNYTGYSVINSKRFGQDFVDRVANPGDLLLFSAKRATNAPKSTKLTAGSSAANGGGGGGGYSGGGGAHGKHGSVSNLAEADELLELAPQHMKIEDFLSNQLNNKLGTNLSVFHSKGLIKALQQYAEKDGTNLAASLQKQLEEVQLHVISSYQQQNAREAAIAGDAAMAVDAPTISVVDRPGVIKHALDFHKKRDQHESSTLFKAPVVALAPSKSSVNAPSPSSTPSGLARRSSRVSSHGKLSSTPGKATLSGEGRVKPEQAEDGEFLDDYEDYQAVDGVASMPDEFSPNASWTDWHSAHESDSVDEESMDRYKPTKFGDDVPGASDDDMELPIPDPNQRKRPPSKKTATPKVTTPKKSAKSIASTVSPIALARAQRIQAAASVASQSSGVAASSPAPNPFSVKRETSSVVKSAMDASFASPSTSQVKGTPKSGKKGAAAATPMKTDDAIIIIDSDEEDDAGVGSKAEAPPPAKRVKQPSASDIQFEASESEEALPGLGSESLLPIGMNTQPSAGSLHLDDSTTSAAASSVQSPKTPAKRGKKASSASSQKNSASSQKPKANALVILEDDTGDSQEAAIPSTPTVNTQRWGRR